MVDASVCDQDLRWATESNIQSLQYHEWWEAA